MPETSEDAGVDPLAWAGLLLLSLCLGSSFLFQKLALAEFSPAAVAALRLVIAAVCLVVLARLAGHGLPGTRQLWAWSAMNGVIGFGLPIYLTVWAQQFISTALIGVIYSGIPLMMLGMSRLVLGVEITRRKAIGLGIGTCGLVLLAGPDISGGDVWANFVPKLMVLLSVVMLAFAGITIRKMPKGSALSGVAASALFVGVISAPVAVATWPAETPGWVPVAAVLAAGVISTGLGQFLRFFLIRRKGPVFVAPNGFLATLVTITLGVAVLGEAVTGMLILGFAVILLGLVISQDGSGQMARV